MVKNIVSILVVLLIGILNLMASGGAIPSTGFVANHLQDMHRAIHDAQKNDADRLALVQARDNLLAGAQSDQVRAEIHRGFNVEMAGRLANGTAMINAYQAGIQGQGKLDLAKELIKPRTAFALGLGALGIFSAWHGTVLVKDAIGRYMRVPELAQKTSLKRWLHPRGDEKVKLDDVVLDQQLKQRVTQLTQAIKNTSGHQGNFRHFLFYGPPGVGKTMLAMGIAEEAGLDYIYFSAAKLELYSLKEAMKQLVNLFEFARSSAKKLIIILDEAEVLFGKRELMADSTRKLLDTLLTYMGTESSHFMVIAITNRPADFDTASLNRFGEKIRIGAPAFDQRKKLFEQYTKKYLIDKTQEQPDTRTFLQKLFRKKVLDQRLFIEPDVLMPEVINDILLKIDGFVGREIADCILAVQAAAYASQERMVSKEMLYAAVDSKIGQRLAEKNGFVEQIN